MSILNNNNKKGTNKQADKAQKNNASSKFIKSSSKSPNVTKKVRSTGANRGS
jgi:hypothetical protein